MFIPNVVLDIFRFFTLFATNKKYEKYKIICRYQQYEEANAIIDRVLASYPKQGLIWHFQGSVMVLAVQKLHMLQELNNATAVIVLDRINLKSQILLLSAPPIQQSWLSQNRKKPN